jgi:hypothetical protein
MNPAPPPAAVLDDVTTWPGVSTQPTPRGSTAIVFAGHELGHVHPDRKTLDLPLSHERRVQVLEAARAKEWAANWVSKPLSHEEDAQDGLTLLRESYDALDGQRVAHLLVLMKTAMTRLTVTTSQR